MSTILMALSLGAVSMIVVFISGMMSGVVRLGTISLRSLLAFCVTSAFTYFILMMFEMYDEHKRKEMDAVAKELAEDEENSAGENSAENNTPGNFQPVNPSDYPQA